MHACLTSGHRPLLDADEEFSCNALVALLLCKAAEDKPEQQRVTLTCQCW